MTVPSIWPGRPYPLGATWDGQPKFIILCNPPYERRMIYDIEDSPVPPMGIMLIATVLKQKGYEIKVINGAVHRNWKEQVLDSLKYKPLFVGFSVMTTQVTDAAEISREIKERAPEVGVIWGGFHCSIFPDQTANYPYLDLIVRGEADKSVQEAAEYFEGNRNITDVSGISYREKESGRILHNANPPFTKFDEIPMVDFGFVEKKEVKIKPQVIDGQIFELFPLLTGLGCCYRCAFCHNAIYQKTYRAKPAARIIDEMNYYSREYGVNGFFFCDEDFFINKKRLFEFLDLLEKNKNRFAWGANCRVIYVNDNYLSKDTLARIKKTGCISLSIGAESGSNRVLQYINKKQTPEQIFNAVRSFSKTGIRGVFSFLTALPTETREEFMETVKLILDIQEKYPETIILGPHCFRPYPGSPLFNTCIEYGLKVPSKIEEWEEYDEAFSHFTKIDFSKMPWIKEEDREFFRKRLYSLYTLQLGKGLRKNIIKRIMGAILDSFKTLQKWRLKSGNYSFYVERPIVKLIESFFFT